MKYIVLIPDGMADLPCEKLGGLTPMEAADKPNMDFLARNGLNGLAHTVPEGMTPESDTANLALMGYDPKIYSRGRSPLEALGMGLEMGENETAVRANLVALSDLGEPYEEKIMLDHSSDEIPTPEADILIKAVDSALGGNGKRFRTGVSYRHCLLWEDCPDFPDFTRPHDFLGEKIIDRLPYKSPEMLEMMKSSFGVLNDHPLNLGRAARGLKKANSVWLWSPGKKPSLPSFKEKTGLNGTVICAVDLMKGIGLCAGMKAPRVDGATGNIDTNYNGKLKEAIKALENGSDYVYIHVEAPDECGHRGETENKIKAIELIDREILCPLLAYLDKNTRPYKILLTPDHPTPVSLRTHSSAPVPFVIYSSEKKEAGADSYSEKNALKSGFSVESGPALSELFLGRG